MSLESEWKKKYLLETQMPKRDLQGNPLPYKQEEQLRRGGNGLKRENAASILYPLAKANAQPTQRRGPNARRGVPVAQGRSRVKASVPPPSAAGSLGSAGRKPLASNSDEPDVRPHIDQQEDAHHAAPITQHVQPVLAHVPIPHPLAERAACPCCAEGGGLVAKLAQAGGSLSCAHKPHLPAAPSGHGGHAEPSGKAVQANGRLTSIFNIKARSWQTKQPAGTASHPSGSGSSSSRCLLATILQRKGRHQAPPSANPATASAPVFAAAAATAHAPVPTVTAAAPDPVPIAAAAAAAAALAPVTAAAPAAVAPLRSNHPCSLPAHSVLPTNSASQPHASPASPERLRQPPTPPASQPGAALPASQPHALPASPLRCALQAARPTGRALGSSGASPPRCALQAARPTGHVLGMLEALQQQRPEPIDMDTCTSAAEPSDCAPVAATIRDQRPAKPTHMHTCTSAAGQPDCAPATATIKDQRPTKPTSMHTLGADKLQPRQAGQGISASTTPLNTAELRHATPASQPECGEGLSDQGDGIRLNVSLVQDPTLQPPEIPPCHGTSIPGIDDQAARLEMKERGSPPTTRLAEAVVPAGLSLDRQPNQEPHVQPADLQPDLQPDLGYGLQPDSQQLAGLQCSGLQCDQQTCLQQQRCVQRGSRHGGAHLSTGTARCAGPGPASQGFVSSSQPFPQLTGLTLPLADSGTLPQSLSPQPPQQQHIAQQHERDAASSGHSPPRRQHQHSQQQQGLGLSADCSPPHTPSSLTLEPVECLPLAPPAPPAFHTPLAAASTSSSSYHTCRGPGVSGSGLFVSIGPSGGASSALGVLDLQDTAGTQAVEQRRHVLTEGLHLPEGHMQHAAECRGDPEQRGITTQQAERGQQLQSMGTERAEGDLQGSMLASFGSDSSASARSQEHPHLASLLPTLEYIELDTGCAAALEGCTGAHPHSQSAPKRHGIDAARVICHVSHQMRARCGYGKGACGAVVGLMDGGGAHSSLVDGKGADVSLVPGKGAGVGLVNEQVEVANGDGVPKGQNLGPGSAEGVSQGSSDIEIGCDSSGAPGGCAAAALGMPDSLLACCGSEAPATLDWMHTHQQQQQHLLQQEQGVQHTRAQPQGWAAEAGQHKEWAADAGQQRGWVAEAGQQGWHKQLVAEAGQQRSAGHLLEVRGSKASGDVMASCCHHHHHQQQQQQQQEDGPQRQGLHRPTRTRRRAHFAQQQQQLPQRQKQKQRENEDAACMHTPVPSKLCRRSSVRSPEQAAGAGAEGANGCCQGSPMAISPAPHVLLPPCTGVQAGGHRLLASPGMPRVCSSAAGTPGQGGHGAACQGCSDGVCLQHHREQQQQQQQDSAETASSADQSPMQVTPAHAAATSNRRLGTSGSVDIANSAELSPMQVTPAPAAADARRGHDRGQRSSGEGSPIHLLHFEQDDFVEGDDDGRQDGQQDGRCRQEQQPDTLHLQLLEQGEQQPGTVLIQQPEHGQQQQQGAVHVQQPEQGEQQPDTLHVQPPEQQHPQQQQQQQRQRQQRADCHHAGQLQVQQEQQPHLPSNQPPMPQPHQNCTNHLLHDHDIFHGQFQPCPPHAAHHRQQQQQQQQQQQEQQQQDFQQQRQVAIAKCGPPHGPPLQPQQQPLPISALLGEECCMDYWQPIVGVYETFPFQKDALEFASWCANAPAADLRYMLSVADSVPYRERWKCIMREVGLCKQMALDRQQAWQHQQQQLELQQRAHLQQQQQQQLQQLDLQQQTHKQQQPLLLLPHGHSVLPEMQQYPVCGPQGLSLACNPQHHPQQPRQQASRAQQLPQQQQQAMMQAQQQQQQQQQQVANAHLLARRPPHLQQAQQQQQQQVANAHPLARRLPHFQQAQQQQQQPVQQGLLAMPAAPHPQSIPLVPPAAAHPQCIPPTAPCPLLLPNPNAAPDIPPVPLSDAPGDPPSAMGPYPFHPLSLPVHVRVFSEEYQSKAAAAAAAAAPAPAAVSAAARVAPKAQGGAHARGDDDSGDGGRGAGGGSSAGAAAGAEAQPQAGASPDGTAVASAGAGHPPACVESAGALAGDSIDVNGRGGGPSKGCVPALDGALPSAAAAVVAAEAQCKEAAPAAACAATAPPKCATNVAQAAAGGLAPAQPQREQVAPAVRSSLSKAGTSKGSEYTRNFIVTTYPELAKRLTRRQPLKRHYYEVLRADQPCHMYFDVEFSQAANPDVKGSQLVSVLVKAVRRLFWDLWCLELPDHCFVELQSQTVDAAHAPIPVVAAAAAAAQTGIRGAISQGEAPGHSRCEVPLPIHQQLQPPLSALQQHAAVPQLQPLQLHQQLHLPHQQPLQQQQQPLHQQPQLPHQQPLQPQQRLLQPHQQPLQPQQQLPQPHQQQRRRPLQQCASNAVEDLRVLPALPPTCQPDKFSVHLIVRAPGGFAFGGSQHVGQAVNLLRGYPELWEELQVFKEVGSSERTSAVDLAVYSRTRHFRTAWSCKGGKNAVLLPTTRFLGSLLLPEAARPADAFDAAGPARGISGHEAASAAGSGAAAAVSGAASVAAGFGAAAGSGAASAAAGSGAASAAAGSGAASAAAGSGAASAAAGSSAASAAAGSGAASAAAGPGAASAAVPMQNTTNGKAPTTTIRPLSCQELLLASMICNVGEGVRVLELPRPPVNPHFMARPGSDPQQLKAAGSKGSGTAVVCDEGALDHPAASHRSLKVTWLDIPQAFSSAEEAAAMGACRHALQRVALRVLRFIEAAATERAGGLQAFVGSLTYCGVSGNVTYSLLGPGSHWCSRIQRSHRSNRVYFLANLSIGNWCQKCFDKDCAGYHSPWCPLPEELLEPLPASQPPKAS